MPSPVSLSLAVLCGAFAVSAQQDAGATVAPTSGPAAGTPVPALSVYAPTGIDAGLDLDVTALFGRAPGVVLFVHELTRNVAPLVRALDRFADSHAPLGLETVTVLLGADRNEIERRAAAASTSLGLTRPLTVSVDGAEGPGSWALDRRAALTLVFCDDGEVRRSVRLTDTGQTDVPALRGWIGELTGPLPDDAGALRAAALAALPDDPATLRARAARSALLLHWRARTDREREARQAGRRRDGGMQGEARGRTDPAAEPGERRPADRVGAPPSDPELRNLLRRAIRRTADATELDAVFRAIDDHVGDDTTLRSEAIEMFRLMLSLDYGTADARRRAADRVREAGAEVPSPARRRDGDR